MRLSIGMLTANTEVLPGVHLLEAHAPLLARAGRPGQYCMLRCCDSRASDPLLRRPFYLCETEPARGLCRFLVYSRGRGSDWLARQQAGMPLDILGPLGHGWEISSSVRNLLLIGEEPVLAAVLFLARDAIERELSVTLIHIAANPERGYPPALLSPEVEYQVCARADMGQLAASLAWADALYCSVSPETVEVLAQTGERWREKDFVQIALWQPFICASGACLACQVETRRGPRLICRDGPSFTFNELAMS